MTITKSLLKAMALGAAIAAGLTACSDNDAVTYQVEISSQLPAVCTLENVELKLTELNTGAVTVTSTPDNLLLPAGTYNIEGTATAHISGAERHLRTVAQNVVISGTATALRLDWFFYNPANTLVFSEIFITGSLNAKGTGCIYDSYFRIHNNTDEVIYADGLALVESENTNGGMREIISDEAKPVNNFVVQTVYVIPGNGTEHPIAPGQSIKIADQGVNFTEQITPAMDNTVADFEWFDEVTVGTLRDVDTDIPNLDKWFSYSKTIWIPTQQCNRSYALVRFPAGMTREQFLADYALSYRYINTKTGTEMTASSCYRIPNSWIIDGVNLCPSSQYVVATLSPAVDMSFASIAYDTAVTNRAGKMFARKVSGISAAGNTIYLDTDDSANDFEIVSVYR